MKFLTWIPDAKWNSSPGLQAQNEIHHLDSRRRMKFITWITGTEWNSSPELYIYICIRHIFIHVHILNICTGPSLSDPRTTVARSGQDFSASSRKNTGKSLVFMQRQRFLPVHPTSLFATGFEKDFHFNFISNNLKFTNHCLAICEKDYSLYTKMVLENQQSQMCFKMRNFWTICQSIF